MNRLQLSAFLTFQPRLLTGMLSQCEALLCRRNVAGIKQARLAIPTGIAALDSHGGIASGSSIVRIYIYISCSVSNRITLSYSD